MSAITITPNLNLEITVTTAEILADLNYPAPSSQLRIRGLKTGRLMRHQTM